MKVATVVVVCTGNVRRSPSIELMLRQGTPTASGLDGTGIEVISAGIAALAGEGVDLAVARELAKVGVNAESHVARQLTVQDIESADLIITAERKHRAAVVALVPAAIRSTFTLRELASLATLIDQEELSSSALGLPQRIVDIVRLAPLRRRDRHDSGDTDDDLADVRRMSARDCRRLVGDVRAAVEQLLRAITSEVTCDAVVARYDEAPLPAPVTTARLA